MLNIEANTWQDLPELNLDRWSGSAVVLNHVAYVLCGEGKGSRALNSIELLPIGGASRGGINEEWQLI